jgi:hypothetical protein
MTSWDPYFEKIDRHIYRHCRQLRLMKQRILHKYAMAYWEKELGDTAAKKDGQQDEGVHGTQEGELENGDSQDDWDAFSDSESGGDEEWPEYDNYVHDDLGFHTHSTADVEGHVRRAQREPQAGHDEILFAYAAPV